MGGKHLDPLGASGKTVVKGDFVAWVSNSPPTVGSILLRDLAQGVTTTVAAPPAGTLEEVGPNGDILFSSPSSLSRWRKGELSVISTFQPGQSYVNGGLTDGTGIIFSDRIGLTRNAYRIVLITPAGTDPLRSQFNISYEPGRDYQLNNGWAAYTLTYSPDATSPDANEYVQAWMRSPAGEKRPISRFANHSVVHAMNPAGEVVFDTGGTLYLSGFDWNTEVRLGPSSLKLYWYGGGWHLVDGGTVYAVAGPFTPKAGEISINLSSPAENAVVNDTPTVTLSTASTYLLKNVTASLGGRQAELKKIPDGNGAWRGELDLSGVPPGEYPLVVRVEDARGTVKTLERTVTRDSLPSIQVESPVPGQVPLSEVRIAATCSDDRAEGCVSLKVYFASDLIAECTKEDPVCVASPGVLKVDRVHPLAAYRPEKWGVTVEATDGRGQVRTKVVWVNVESGGGLKLEDTVPGIIQEANADYILYRAVPDDPNAPDPYAPSVHENDPNADLKFMYALRVYDRKTKQDVEVKLQGKRDLQARVTPKGALVLVEEAGKNRYQLYEWREGQLIPHGDNVALDVEGGFAAWETPSEIHYIDYSTGKAETIPTQQEALTYRLLDVSSEGGLLLEKSEFDAARREFVYTVMVWKSGVFTSLPLSGT